MQGSISTCHTSDELKVSWAHHLNYMGRMCITYLPKFHLDEVILSCLCCYISIIKIAKTINKCSTYITQSILCNLTSKVIHIPYKWLPNVGSCESDSENFYALNCSKVQLVQYLFILDPYSPHATCFTEIYSLFLCNFIVVSWCSSAITKWKCDRKMKWKIMEPFRPG